MSYGASIRLGDYMLARSVNPAKQLFPQESHFKCYFIRTDRKKELCSAVFLFLAMRKTS